MLNPFGPQWVGSSHKSTEAQAVGEQVQDSLFGKKKPPILDEDEFPEIKEVMAMLNGYRRKFAIMIGDSEKDYRLQLADGTIAMIDNNGIIFLGVKFLQKFKDNPEVLIGVLAHEIGHRPQRWNEYKEKQKLKPRELESLCRYEETRADLFAGRALAEVGMDCEPMINFLEVIEEGPHPEYFPADLRAEVIREGFSEQANKVLLRQKFWPELERHTSPKHHLGDY